MEFMGGGFATDPLSFDDALKPYKPFLTISKKNIRYLNII